MTGPGPGRPAETGSVDVPTTNVRFVGHATVLIEIDGTTILTDPFLRHRLGPLERHGPRPDAGSLGDIDIVLVSHGHPDHFDRASLGSLRGRPTVIVPRGLGAAARRAVEGEVVELLPGDRTVVGRISITAFPARHWISPGAPRAQPVGYLVEAGTRVYFAGDTGRFPAMRELAGAVDIALLPVWSWGPHLGPGHLGPEVGRRGRRRHPARRGDPHPLGHAVPSQAPPRLAPAADRARRSVRGPHRASCSGSPTSACSAPAHGPSSGMGR